METKYSITNTIAKHALHLDLSKTAKYVCLHFQIKLDTITIPAYRKTRMVMIPILCQNALTSNEILVCNLCHGKHVCHYVKLRKVLKTVRTR